MNARTKALVGMLLAALAAVPATAQSTRFGVVPPVEKLAVLRHGQSTMQDVRSTLGMPQGEGAARMPDYPGLRTTWAYEYSAMEGSQSTLFLLVVFFEGERYDGYLWFDLPLAYESSS